MADMSMEMALAAFLDVVRAFDNMSKCQEKELTKQPAG